MDYLHQLSDAARRWCHPSDVPGAVWVLLALLLIVCLHFLLLSTIWFRVLVRWRVTLLRLFQPDLFPKGSVWRDRAAAWQQWMDRWSCEITMPSVASSIHGDYVFVKELVGGDLCSVHVVEQSHRRFILKQTRTADGNSLLRKEFTILRQLHDHSADSLYAQYLPCPVDSVFIGDRQATTFAWRDGFIDASVFRRHYPQGLEGRQLAWMFKRLLEVLGYAHHLGWIHGGVLPPHLLFHPHSHGLQLLGWIHAERLGMPLHVVPAAYKTWYPPECHARHAATPATDIYLAARCIQWFAGGSALSQHVPDHMPSSMQRCLQECLSDAPALRPQDAWDLHEEFTELLEDVYGPPRFCPLALP